jgi:hypothetical protein
MKEFPPGWQLQKATAMSRSMGGEFVHHSPTLIITTTPGQSIGYLRQKGQWLLRMTSLRRQQAAKSAALCSVKQPLRAGGKQEKKQKITVVQNEGAMVEGEGGLNE